MRRTVLVTDGEQRSALAVVRSLGNSGLRVLTVSAHPLPIAGGSRFCALQLRAPDPTTCPSEFAEAVVEHSKQEHVDWVIPMTEAALRALLPDRHRLSALIPFPSLETFESISDKAKVLERAATIGIDIPHQVIARTPQEILPTETLTFPLAIKPSRSVSAGHHFNTQYATCKEELSALIAGMPEAAFPLLLQERLAGPGMGVFLLIWDGEVKAIFGHKRIREKPPSGGVSVVAESIELEPHLLAKSIELLRSFDWQGVAMVEYKHDTASGRTALMEVNGRFWGSLQLAIDAGVDFPRLLISCVEGKCPLSPPPYKVAVRSRWWLGDVGQVLMRFRKSAQSLDLLERSAGRISGLRAFLTERARNEVLRRDDPVPAIRESINWILRR